MNIRFENIWTQIKSNAISAKAQRYDITIEPKSHIVYDWASIERSVERLMQQCVPDRKIQFVDETTLLINGNNVHYSTNKFSINLHISNVWRQTYPHVSLEDKIKGMLYRRYSLDADVIINTYELYSDSVMFYGDRRGDSGLESSYFYPNMVEFKLFKNHLVIDNDAIMRQVREFLGKVYLPKNEIHYHDKQSTVCLRKVDGSDLTFGFDHDYDSVVILPEGGTHPQAIANLVAENIRRFSDKVDYIIMFLNGIEYRSKVIPEI